MRAPQSRQPDPDRLPPHSPEAERGVLGCLFLAPASGLPEARTVFGSTQPFYDLRHARIFAVLGLLADEGTPIDSITFHQKIKDLGADAERETGGLAYWNSLADTVPSAANLAHYLHIVREKFVLRQSIAAAQRYISTVYTWEGTVTQMLENTSTEFTALAAAAHAQANPNATPPHVKTCAEFGEQFHNSFYGADAVEPGLPLPFAHENFPLRIRGGELTLVLGEKGVGKSTILGWIGLNLLQHGMKLFIASMEMKPEHTLKIMASQLLGKNKFEDTPENHQLTAAALAWLNRRVVIYDFLGITDWRELLEAKRYAAEFMGCNLFITDSMMRLGIMDDDYAQQGQCVMAFSSFCMATNSHEFLVNHLNKAQDKSAKARSRGSQQLIDNANNVVSLQRNEKKGEKLAEIFMKRDQEKAARTFDAQAFANTLDELNTQWDSKFTLHNQRLPGTRQNGSIYLYFDRPSQQMRSQPPEPVGVNYLARWTKGNQR